MVSFSNLSPSELTTEKGFDCSCGLHHGMYLKYLQIGHGAIESITEAVKTIGSVHPMVVCAPDVYEKVGKKVDSLLTNSNVSHSFFVVSGDANGNIEPAEEATGSVVLNFDQCSDLLIGVGSGVINDICRVVSTTAKIPMLIVGTAPSMDGYASASSSMVVSHIKQSLPLKAPDGIILDTDVMANAPMKLLSAGLGDVLAKYTALCEWKLARLLRNEPYCTEVSSLVKNALDKVVANACGLKKREPKSVQAVAEGLVLSGIGMAFVGHSRPASGLDHYFSHCWEMMALSRNKGYELHGIQVGLGTLYTVMLMEKLKTITPTMEHVEASIASFDKHVWENNIRRVFGDTADGIINMEAKLLKNDAVGRRVRAQKIIDNWDEVLHIIDESIPSSSTLRAMMEDAGLPTNYVDIGITLDDVIDAFVCSRDIREKYLTSSIIWDIGYMEEFASWLRHSIS